MPIGIAPIAKPENEGSVHSFLALYRRLRRKREAPPPQGIRA
jgi:hypothetical protein